MIAVTGSVIFGCGAKTFVVGADKDSNLASLEKNIKMYFGKLNVF